MNELLETILDWPTLHAWDVLADEFARMLLVNPTDGSVLLLVPGGKFLAGEERFEVELPPYYLGITPVTNEQYKRFVKATGHYAGAGWQEEQLNHPAVGVSWNDVQAYCGWAGLRLPSELEWEKAARGVDGQEYPWGDGWDPHKCRNSGNCGSELTCDVWSYPEGCSYWGHYQMSGNVSEWCADSYGDGTQYKRDDSNPPQAGRARVVRGGSFGRGSPYDFQCSRREELSQIPDISDYRDIYYGFRVARTFRPKGSPRPQRDTWLKKTSFSLRAKLSSLTQRML